LGGIWSKVKMRISKAVVGEKGSGKQALCEKEKELSI